MSQQQVMKYLLGGGALGVSASVVFGGSALFPDAIDTSSLENFDNPAVSSAITIDGSIEAADVWGFIQVQIKVENSEITGIKLLQYPTKDRESSEINASALPLLIESALQSQSADISNVSGATYSSTAFKNSLQAALMEAGL